jgi:hypothetical protein
VLRDWEQTSRDTELDALRGLAGAIWRHAPALQPAQRQARTQADTGAERAGADASWLVARRGCTGSPICKQAVSTRPIPAARNQLAMIAWLSAPSRSPPRLKCPGLPQTCAGVSIASVKRCIAGTTALLRPGRHLSAGAWAYAEEL